MDSSYHGCYDESMTRRIAYRTTALAMLLLACAFAVVAARGTQPTTPRPVSHPAAAAVSTVTTTTCTVPAPTSAAGYAAMFASVPTTQWGGADVSISVRVGSTNVWLYGDTISNVTSWS